MSSKYKIVKYFLALLIIGLVCLPSFVSAQLDPAGLSRFTEKDGLPSESINALLIDSKGYLWTGTPNGLSRFDGYEFNNFFSNPIDSTAIRGMLIYSLFEDSQHRIWMGTNPNYLEVFEPITNSFKTYDYQSVIDPFQGSNPLYGYRLFCIQEDASGRIFFTVGSYLDEPWLLYLDPKDGTIKKLKDDEGKDLQGVYDIFRDHSDRVWLNTNNGIFYIENDGTLVRFNALDKEFQGTNEFPINFYFTKDGHFWVLTRDSRLIDYDRELGTYRIWQLNLFKKDNDNAILSNTMIFDDKGTFWLGTDQGIYFFNAEKGEFGTFKESGDIDLGSMSVSSFAIDHFGDLWIGSNNKGLFRYEVKPEFLSFTNGSDDNSLTEDWASNIIEDQNGGIWIHNNGGLNRLDPTSMKIEKFPNATLNMNAMNISCIWKEGEGIAMILYQKNKYYYVLRDGRISKKGLSGLPEQVTIISRLIDSKGDVWFGTDDGLYRRDKNGQGYRKYDLRGQSDTLTNNARINELFESQKHGLWLITDGGLYLYNYQNDRISHHGFDKSKGGTFLTQDINSFYEDDEGIAWVGLWQGGLASYDIDKGEIRTYTTEDGLPSMSVQGILGDDENGTIWMSTFNGISRFDKATEKFNNFSIMDGIQGSQFSEGAYLKTSGGLMVFGGSNGITLFDPDKIKTGYQPPEVFLTDFKLFNKSVRPGEGSVLSQPIDQTEQIILAHDQNDLSFEYIGLHYSNPIKNRYAYKLENYDEDWREVGSQNEAFYPNLSPGHYTFRVRAANDKGVWSEDKAFVEITVTPPWWRTWWAYFGYFMLIVFLGWRFHIMQRNHVIRRERERTQKRELEQSREIERAYKELKATQSQLIQSEKMASLGELTAGIAHEIQNPLNFVNNFAEVSTELIDEMNEELDKGQLDEVKSISSDLKQNLDKITHHGKRADSIVKGMLQHSRSSSGVKELTDINALADEYLRLSYHGLRAQDKTFNADFKAELDPTVPNLKIVPQEMGRVLLNLVNNAFYAVKEKSMSTGNGYHPMVKVITKNKGDTIEISVTDNGPGIPEEIKEKVFQPFFTSKPTGEGTGLGLSLSYDIIKAHGGILTLKTDGEYRTEFIITLPQNETV